MAKYIVKHGQNIFDIASHLYGSIDGVIDLLMKNSGLSYSTILKSGDTLEYSPDFIVDTATKAGMSDLGITPSNGSGLVYFREMKDRQIEIRFGSDVYTAEFMISGAGTITVDWGDNSDLQTQGLSGTDTNIKRTFNIRQAEDRIVRIGGVFTIKNISFSKVAPRQIFLTKPIYSERLSVNKYSGNLEFVRLLPDLIEANIESYDTSILPLIDCKNMMSLNLSGTKFLPGDLDAYLKKLVSNHFERRNCTVTLTTNPSGEYIEPSRDENLNYIINTGMEAIWVITNEPSWNIGGYWKFIINGITYTSEV